MRLLFQKLIDILGVSAEKKPAVDELLKLVPEESPKPPEGNQGGSGTGGDDKVVSALREELKAMRADNEKLLKLLNDEKAAREAAQSATADQQKKEREKKVADYIAAMKADGRLAAKDDEMEKHWKQQFEASFDSAKIIADALPKKFTQQAGSGNTGGDSGEKSKNKAPLMELPEAFAKYTLGGN